MKHRLLALLVLPTALVLGCATRRQWTPTVDTYGSSRAQYVTRDLDECRILAMRASGARSDAAARAAVEQGLVGAAAGASVGAAFRNPSAAVAGGGPGGGAGRAAHQTAASEAIYQRSLANCMRQRGHAVSD